MKMKNIECSICGETLQRATVVVNASCFNCKRKRQQVYNKKHEKLATCRKYLDYLEINFSKLLDEDKKKVAKRMEEVLLITRQIE